MIRKGKRIGALLLSAALVVTQLPAVAMAENNPPEDGAIASFEKLDSGVAKQTVPVGTELAELNLPDTVKAKVCHVTEEEIPQEEEITDENASTASPSNADGNVSDSGATDRVKTITTVTTSTEDIPVTWDSAPAYDGDVTSNYVFTADVGGYVLADGVKPPQIIVTVKDDSPESQPEEPKPCEKTEGCMLPDGHEGECVTEPPTADNALVKTITG